MKVSLILPSLNVHQYIEECLESVVNQTLTDIEIICVDAGSTDGTLEIIRAYEKKDSRITVLISDKKSYGYQMNMGIDYAKGEYIGIVETDDYVPADMYERLYNTASENSVDFIKADFYRFTGKDESLSKAYHKLFTDSSLYNRVLDIERNQKCFYFVMNTWSGIYKRTFLCNNNIRHNETPGASFQDNGFWFQTFMYAKRAFFLNEAFYMNRRDNANSSVYSKEKVYCICDEYRFIYNIIKKNELLLKNFRFIFATVCFRAYRANLNRIAEEYKKDFLIKWSEDFRQFRKEGLINFRMFNRTDWEMLLDIMDNPVDYYENVNCKERAFFSEAKCHSNIIIYGAGMIGRRVYDRLKYNNNPADIVCFAVTKKDDNYDNYKGTPIITIDELSDYREKGYVLIATTSVYQNEIIATLSKKGFKNIFPVPDTSEKEESYYEKLSAEEREEMLCKWFYKNTGKELHLHPPVSFEEKQQYIKLYDESELKRFLSDKINARKWVENKIGPQYLTQIFGIYDNADTIPFENLPERFIIKCSHGSMMNEFIDNKSLIDLNEWEVIKRRVNSCLKKNYAYSSSMDLLYENAVPKVIVELPIEDNNVRSDNLKIVCKNGVPDFIISEKNKQQIETTTRDYFDVNWGHINYTDKYPNSNTIERKPDNLRDILNIAQTLSSDFDFAVIHLFNVSGKILFNEIKFLLDSGV